jgi:UDP-N-acetylmuramoyl-tripeptide--D-alanyl-D-alanine ligase
MEVTERADGVLVVNDAYNANPESMRAALTALRTMSRARRSWAVLGQMAELGTGAEVEHDALGRFATGLGVDRLVVVGPKAGAVHTAAAADGSWRGESVQVPDVGAAVRLLRRELRPGDVVLVKASRVDGLERVAAALLPAPDPAGGASR